MKYVKAQNNDPNYHGTGKAGFKNKVPPAAGTDVDAGDFNDLWAEIVKNFIEACGLTPSDTDLQQLRKAAEFFGMQRLKAGNLRKINTSAITGGTTGIFAMAGPGNGTDTSKLVAVGDTDGARPLVLVNFDGTGRGWWHNTAPAKSAALRAVIPIPFTPGAGNMGYIAVGDPDGVDAYIVGGFFDGGAMTERANPKNIRLNALATDGTTVVAVGHQDGTDAYIITTTDGFTWTERANPKNITLWAVQWIAALNLYVAAGNYDGTDPYVLTSPDGINWTERAISGATNYAIYSLCWHKDRIVAFGTSTGSVMSVFESTDGINWTKIDLLTSATLAGIVYAPVSNGHQLLAVGNNVGGGIGLTAHVWAAGDLDGTAASYRRAAVDGTSSASLYAAVWAADVKGFVAGGSVDAGDTRPAICVGPQG